MVLGSFLLIVNINRRVKCGYRFNLPHSKVLKQYNTLNNKHLTHLKAELKRRNAGTRLKPN
jgi:hypothetical protein